MTAFLRNIFSLFTAITLIAFALANRQSVPLIFSPVHDSIELPLYAIALGLMGIGFVFGGFVVWVNNGTTRKTRRQQRKTIKALEKQISTLKEAPSANVKAPPSELFPALPASENSSIKSS